MPLKRVKNWSLFGGLWFFSIPKVYQTWVGGRLKRPRERRRTCGVGQWPTICGFLWICWLKKNVNFYSDFVCTYLWTSFIFVCFMGFLIELGYAEKNGHGHGWWFQHVSSTVVDCPASFLGIGSTARSVENPTTGMINGARRHLNESYMSTTNPL